MNRLCVLGALFAVLVGLGGLPPRTVIRAQGPGGAMALFGDVARRTDVPLPVLVGLAWEQSGLVSHGGRPSIDRGYGLLDLSARPAHNTLRAAAALVGQPPAALRVDNRLNLLGGARLLARFERAAAGRLPVDPGAWAPAIVRFTGMRSRFAARLLLDDLFGRLRRGLRAGGVALPPMPGLRPRLGMLRGLIAPVRPRQTGSGADYPGALWQPANTNNYTDASRPTKHRIRYIVIHDTEGSCAAAVNWFQNPAAQASAHYVVCLDGTVIQTVRERNIAWQAGNWPVNQASIGIEHEGYADSAYYTRAQYLASAALVRYLARKYGIPVNRNGIVGHENVPGATHTDPGVNWNWSFYMGQIRGDEAGYTGGSPAVLTVTGNALVYTCPRPACATLGSANWGEQFAVTGRRPGWERINFAGQTGWIGDAAVAAGSGYVLRTSVATTLRDGPGRKDNALATVPAGQRYVSVVRDGGWWYVAYNHRYGFLPVSSVHVTDCRVGRLAGCLGTGLTLLPNAAPAGTAITVAGSGAAPGGTVWLVAAGQPLGAATADAAGRFSTQVSLPTALPTGAQQLVAASSAGTMPRAVLQVRAPSQLTPRVTLSQSSLAPGDGVTISGTGLPGLAAVTLTVSLSLAGGKTKTMLIHTFSQPNGTLAPVHVTIPTAALPGAYALTARSLGAQGQATLLVEGEGTIGTPGTATPSPTAAPSPTPTPATPVPPATPTPTPTRPRP